MRVLLVTPSMSALMGGVTVSIGLLAQVLSRKHEVEIWTTTHQSDRIVPALAQAARVRFFPLALRPCFVAPKLVSEVRALGNRFDAINVFHFWTFFGLLGALAASSHRNPIFIHTDGIFLPAALRHHSWKKALARLAGARALLNQFTAAIACNAIEVPAIREWGFRKPVHVLPNAVLPHKAVPGAFRLRHSIPTHAPLVAYLNRFHPIKRVVELCRSFEKVQAANLNVVFVLAGDCSGSYGREVRALAECTGLQARFVGHLTDIEKWELLADADVLCQYSAQESQSNALTEALAAGVPVVISRGCNFESVAAADAGIVVDSVEEMAQATTALLANPGVRARMGQHASEFVSANFGPNAIRRTYEDIISCYTDTLVVP